MSDSAPSSDRKRYAIVGTGGRSRMFTDAIIKDFADVAELVAFCDLSETRMRYWNRYLREDCDHPEVPTFSPEQFDEMVKQVRPDVVIVTTMDATHDQYIIRAMELGCDTVTEKPMTTDQQKVAGIFDAIERTGRQLRVAFNYRWQPAFSLVQEIVASGKIGRPTLVDFQWRLDTKHGADYFRRWHREKQYSGGLLVHKSTHHFDLVNWILGDRPAELSAFGDLAFYGEKNAKDRGVKADYERYTGSTTREQDPFALDLRDGGSLEGLYHDAEKDSGYIRDRNVFGGESKWPITSEDTMVVNARFTGGTLFSYSLVAYCPWEGERLCVTGTEGQVEYFGRGGGHVISGQSDEELADSQYQGERYVRLQRMFEAPEEIEIPEATGGHGGGDARLLERIFRPDLPADPQHRDATHVDGAWSVLTGVAANQAIETGKIIRLDDLAPASLVQAPVGASA